MAVGALAIGVVTAWAGKPGFQSTPTSSTYTTTSGGSAAIGEAAALADPSPTSDVTGVGVSATFSGKGFGNGDVVEITASVSFLVGCVNGSGKYVPADVKKVGAGGVAGTYVYTTSSNRNNGVVTNGQVYSNTVPWPYTGSDPAGSLSCPTGQTPTWIGIEFSSITVSWTGSSGLIDSELASPPAQTWLDPAYRVNG
jgi:hypothetical protein